MVYLNLLNLEAAQAWKALGGPQEPNGPAMFWAKGPDGNDPWELEWFEDWEMANASSGTWCVAPDALTALDWLEQEKGWKWGRTKGTPPYMAWHRDSTGPYNRNAGGVDPSSLILAIAAKMQEAKHDPR